MPGHPSYWISPNCPGMPSMAAVGDQWTCSLCGQVWKCFRKGLPQRDHRNGTLLPTRHASWYKID